MLVHADNEYKRNRLVTVDRYIERKNAWLKVCHPHREILPSGVASSSGAWC
jgi:hypothetical protein